MKTNRETGALGFVLSLILLSGCVNLTGVREFARVSAESTGFQGISQDFVATLERRKVLESNGTAPDYESLLRKRREIKERLDASQQLLVDYLSALEALAANDLVIYNDELDAAEKSAAAANLSNALDLRKYRAAAGLMARCFTDIYRQRKLKNIIPAANGAVQESIEHLKTIVKEDYGLSIQNELDEIELYFGKITASAQERQTEGLTMLAVLALKDKRDDLKQKSATSRAYERVLNKISEGHADLTRNITKITTKEMRRQLASYAREIKSLYQALK